MRTAEAAALLLRNGTALISSPNHKTAADAIGAAAQKTKNRRHRDGCDKPIQPIQQPAMAGNDLAGILDAEAPLDRGLEEIAELRNHRKNAAHISNSGPAFPRSSAAKPAATARLSAKPPMAPAQVFLGLTRGQSFGPPMPRPAK